ncbi:unnamed protein product, partial [Didymodactylos carnosus]
IIEAEALLLEQKRLSDNNDVNKSTSAEIKTKFYTLIPHNTIFEVNLNDQKILREKMDLCQMLQDMLTVNEMTCWNTKASIEAKYRSLKCYINTVDKDTFEYKKISEMIYSTTNINEQVIIHNIFDLTRQTERINFKSNVHNQSLLFHGSKYSNFLGILSRGLLMPKILVNEEGGSRTDIGHLGYGLYFSDSVSTSLQYTVKSNQNDKRLLCMCNVALGNSANYYSYSYNLTQPPDEYHSVHGVKMTNENRSMFKDNEYVIYNLDQQRLVYLVEVSWKPYDTVSKVPKILPLIRDQPRMLSDQEISIEVPDIIDDEPIKLAEQDYGLISNSGQQIPLKAFHIRAQLVDITAEVVLYQLYHNKNLQAIEAKYIFPLDEHSTVCGFEAHINNKIIIGVVKEKEQAKKEYREAIQQGHGAYLMDQEQPEVFSVSVGNLPPNCEVVVKITYVCDLPIENDDIVFRIPSKVASWQAKEAIDDHNQTLLPSIGITDVDINQMQFSLKASIQMPYDIQKLFSPTHRVSRKLTDCQAMIELIDNIFDKDFILTITLKTMNLPRMLVETWPNSESKVCVSSTIFDQTSSALWTLSSNQEIYIT